MKSMKILLVEDDIPLAEGLKNTLRRKNYAVDWVSQGQLAIEAVRAGDIELLILDLGLPDIDGLDVLKQIKRLATHLPVLILTARDDVEHKVKGLDFGADDYLVKPFDIDELLARLRVIERRRGTSDKALISINEITLDGTANLLFNNNQEISVSRREYMIVKSLMENSGRIQSKAQLENTLYEWGEEVSSNTIEVHIHNVRKKLPKAFIETVRGVGYIVRKA
jgi:DNA-binding response OmpR family regulator